MHHRPFGSTGFLTSDIGVGCWQFGGDWGQVSDDQALGALNAAYDAGVNFIDTADVYGAGRSETLIGRFLRDRKLAGSGEVFIATKLGRLHGYPDNYSLDLFRRCTEDSLSRLGVEALDLTQLHCIPPHYLETGEVFDWLRTLKQEGKIRHFGVSVEAMDEALTCLKQPDVAALQVIFNIFRQKPIHTLFARAKQQGVAILARVPLASGLLAGKFTRSTTFAPRDHRTYNRDGQAFNPGETFAGLPFEMGVALVEELRKILDKAKVGAAANATMAQLALRWIIDFDAVSVVIPGAKDAQQARDNALAGDLPPLSDGLHAELAAFYESRVKTHIRGPY